MTSRIANYIRSGHPGIAIASHEEARVEAELKTIAADLGRPLHAWSATRGLVDTRRVVYVVSAVVFFLFLATKALQGNKGK